MDEQRRNFIKVAVGAAVVAPACAFAAEGESPMSLFEAIDTRRSVRVYTGEAVSDADIERMLKAAMMSPSAVNERPWEFVVIRDKARLDKVGEVNRYAAFAKSAPLAILVCLNEEKVKAPGMGVIDVSMASENLLLAARALNLGAVFTGIFPEAERIKGFRELCELPETVTPIGLIVIGHPKNPEAKRADGRYDPAAVHWNTWAGKK